MAFLAISLAEAGGNDLKGDVMTRAKGQSRTHEKIGWQVICPTCVKYSHPGDSPDCDLCRKHGVTENILCTLTRMDQKNDSRDFRCDAYQSKLPLQ
jgi:hypothetical protein